MTAYRELCLDMSELNDVIRQLRTMSGFNASIEDIRRVQQKGSEQQVKLRQSAIILGDVADLYTGTELKNLDGDNFIEAGSRFFAQSRAPEELTWSFRKMVPEAESFFGTKVVIQRNP